MLCRRCNCFFFVFFFNLLNAGLDFRNFSMIWSTTEACLLIWFKHLEFLTLCNAPPFVFTPYNLWQNEIGKEARARWESSRSSQAVAATKFATIFWFVKWWGRNISFENSQHGRHWDTLCDHGKGGMAKGSRSGSLGDLYLKDGDLHLAYMGTDNLGRICAVWALTFILSTVWPPLRLQ